MLTPGQEQVIAAFKDGHNLFITGPGGSGKTYIVARMRAMAADMNLNIEFTATTGVAAYLLTNARTIHAWAGIGLGRESSDVLIGKVRANSHAASRWRSVHVLVIDEVSMMTEDLLAKLDAIACALRKSPRPMGGIQLVLVGDFLQLPPIQPEGRKLLFETDVWTRLSLRVIYLSHIIRQDDQAFRDLLNRVRVGIVDDYVQQTLVARLLPRDPVTQELILPERPDQLKPVCVYMTNREVQVVNDRRLGELGRPTRDFLATAKYIPRTSRFFAASSDDDSGKDGPVTGSDLDQALRSLPIDTRLTVCIGAQVMLVRNIDVQQGLVNGAQGRVTGFDADTGFPVVAFPGPPPIVLLITPEQWTVIYNGRLVSVRQVPLRVSYAVTCHKIQGQTIRGPVLVDLGKSVFEHGQAYVALSRACRLEDLYLCDLDVSRIRAHPKAVAFYQQHHHTGM